MGKRKNVSDVADKESLLAEPPAKKLVGILKPANSPSRSANKSVTFPPPDGLGQTLKQVVNEEIDSGDLAVMIGLLESLRGPSLVLWLTELQSNIAVLGSHKNEKMGALVTELLKLKWADQGADVVNSYKNFMMNLVSANVKYMKAAVKALLLNFKRVKEEEKDTDSRVFKNTHNVLKGLLTVSPVGARDEILEELSASFPFYKAPSYKQLCFIAASLEVTRYVANSKSQVLCILFERLIKLDAHLSRDFIDKAYRERNDDDDLLDEQVRSLDVFMELMFAYVRDETHTLDEFDSKKAESFVDGMMKIFFTHVLPTFNIIHTQFLFFYLASLSPAICSRFLLENWRAFSNPNTPSILRQTSMAYISSFLSRAAFTSVSLVMTYLDRITTWAMSYLRTRETQASNLDFMYCDLNQHGPFYSACQAIFYVFAFRHSELTATEARMKTLQGMSWQTLITSSLNPLRVCLPGVVGTFSAIARGYQLAYCNSIIQRNNRINLPVVGSLSQSSSKGKPLLLDCFFPFDPYILENSRSYVEPIYRPFTGEIVDESEEEDDSESESENTMDTTDSGLGKSRRDRLDSIRSSTSSCGRKRTDSIGSLNELLMQDIVPASAGLKLNQQI